MKKLIFLLFLVMFVFATINLTEVKGIPNPAAVYCKELGYEYKIVKTEQGERGVCVFPDKECEEWDFFKGVCGEEYSYCVKQEYDTKTMTDGKNPYSLQYTVCIYKKGKDKGKKVGSVTDLMNLDVILKESGAKIEEESIFSEETTIPPSITFDWRNKDGQNWITPVKNQGYCGSCWAFAAVGAVEGDANIEYNDPGLDMNLSEQDLVSCCNDCYPVAGCSGGWSYKALDYIKNTGVVDEPCFPYTATDESCSNKCADWQTRTFQIANYGYISSGVKDYLIDSGPIVTYLYMGGSFNSEGIYTCSSPNTPNHAVVLVGYNDTGGYWILKNSWGETWNADGYFKLAYGNCNVQFGNYIDTIPDTIPPSPVTDLSIIRITGTRAFLEWTATGDDGMTGAAWYYRIAYSTNPITEDNFDSLEYFTRYASLPAGTKVDKIIPNLYPETTYYFAIKAYDDLENPSDISNVVSSTTNTGIILFNDDVESGDTGWNKSWVKSFDEPPGEDDPVLWHITEYRSTSPTHSWYYGIEGQWNYDTGSANNGSLITPVIDIADYNYIYLILKYSADLEPWAGDRYQDDFRGYNIIDGEKTGGMTGISFDNRSTNGEFIKKMFRLEEGGETLRVSFDFDSMDKLYNDYEGIYLDDIQIIADGGKPFADANGPYVNENGNFITFDGSGSYDPDGDTLNYFWNFGDGSYGWNEIVTHSYSSPGIYDVALWVNDGSLSVVSYTTATLCFPSGSVFLSLDPTNPFPYDTVTATVSGLSGCDGKKVYVRIGSYRVLRCVCIVSGSGCQCTFTAPSEGTHTYYAQIDMNDDGDFDDPGEESAGVTLTVNCQSRGEPCGTGYPPCCGSYSCRDGVCKYVGGGCPILKVYDGKEFVTVEKLNIHAPEGIDTEVQTSFKMEPINGQYKIKLSEMWYALLEGSHIDYVKLVDETGKECRLISAIHSKDGNVLPQLAKDDDVRVETKPGQDIVLTFTGCSGNTFSFSIEGYNLIRPPVKIALTYMNIIAVLIAVIVVVVVVFGGFKYFARKK